MAAYAGVLLAGLSGHRLCVGLDGHIGLELPNSRCCGGCDQPEAKDPSGASVQQWLVFSGDCASCMDIPLSFAADDHQAPQSGRTLPPPQVASDKCQGASEQTLVAGHWTLSVWLQVPARSAPILSLRSVVLRI